MYYLPRTTWALPRTVQAQRKKQKDVFFRIKIHAGITANIFPQRLWAIFHCLFIRLLILMVREPPADRTSPFSSSIWNSSCSRRDFALALTRDAKLDLCSSAPFPLNLLLCSNTSFSAVTKGKWVLLSLTSRCTSRAFRAQGVFVTTDHCWSWASATLSFFSYTTFPVLLNLSISQPWPFAHFNFVHCTKLKVWIHYEDVFPPISTNSSVANCCGFSSHWTLRLLKL